MEATYVKVNGILRYVYRAVDQDGQVIDVLLMSRRDATAARRFFTRPATTTCIKADLREVAPALAALTSLPHPLEKSGTFD